MRRWVIRHCCSYIKDIVCLFCHFKQRVQDLALTDYFKRLIILSHLVLLTMSMSQFQTVYESLLIDYESMKRKRETKWEKTWRQNKKEEEGEGEEKSDALAAHQHCLFQALFFYSSVLVLQSLHQENLQEEQHKWGISSHFASTRLGNVSNGDFFLNFNAANAVKRAEISLENITDFHQGITQSHCSYSADEKHISDCKRRQKAQFVFWSQRIRFYFHLSNQALITSLTMTNSWLTKLSVCWEASF